MLIVLGTLSVGGPVAAATPSYVNGGSGFADAFPANSALSSAFTCTAGNAILVAVATTVVESTSVTDDASNTYAKLGSAYDTGGGYMTFWLAMNIATQTDNVVTVNAATSTHLRICAAQLSNVPTSGAHDTGYAPAGNSDASTPLTTTTDTTVGNNELIVAAFYDIDDVAAYSSSSPSVLRLTAGSDDFVLVTNAADAQGSWTASVTIDNTDNHGCYAKAIIGT